MATRLDISVHNSNLKISSKEPQVKVEGNLSSVNLNKKERKFSIKQKFDRVEINNYPPDKQLYRKNPTDLRRQESNYSQKKGQDAISQYVREGDRLMRLESEEKNALSNIAKENSYAKGKVEIQISHFPQEPIEIDVKKGHIDIDYEPSKVKPEVQKNLKIETTPGELQIGADRYPKVEIQAITTTGNNLDTKI